MKYIHYTREIKAIPQEQDFKIGDWVSFKENGPSYQIIGLFKKNWISLIDKKGNKQLVPNTTKFYAGS